NGALLADDMGLGKTLQTLAFLAWVQEQCDRGSKPFLVVAPTGLLRNWEAEEDLHLSRPGLGQLFRAYGPDLKELAQMRLSERHRRLAQTDWVMTTYETLRDRINLFVDIHWGVVVYDEVQKIKNPTSLTHDMAKSVHADFYLALTGTPVENRIADIWSIMDTIAPGQLGSLKAFESFYEKASTSEESDSAGQLSSLRSQLLEEHPPTRVLRRMKEDHLSGLPSIQQNRIEKVMPDRQTAAYDAIVDQVQNAEVGPGSTLKALQHLRRVSLLPEDPGPEGITDETVQSSARLTGLFQVVDDIANSDQKVLVFIEYREIQDLLIQYIQQRYSMQRPPLRINGQTSGHRRQKIVEEFQQADRTQFDLFLLSPKAAGVGLTLTAANNVVHLSRWWNPAVEDQCTDRVYRIGQDRAVSVHYPMAIHPRYQDASFDRNLHKLLERKRSLSKQLLAPSDCDDQELEQLLDSSLAPSGKNYN
ncbi:DEAD/DEAH box helicase, partial [Salinisphaera sp. P385]